MEEKKILIKGINSCCRIEGEGKPLLILHGWGLGSSNSWMRAQKMLSLQGFFVIAPDFPGFGQSQKPPEPWSISDYADWLKELIKRFQLKDLYIIAHSFGGRVVVKYIAEEKEDIEKLILVSPAGVKPAKSIDARLAFWLSKVGNILFELKYLKKFKESAAKIFYLFLRKSDYAKSEGVMRETIKKVLEEDLTFYLKEINSKTLLVWGQNDRIVPLKNASIFKNEIKDSELKIIPKAGHSPHLENPERFLETIIPFLK